MLSRIERRRDRHQLGSATAISALSEECGYGADPAVAVTVALHAGEAGTAFLDEVARRVSLVVSCAAFLVDPSVLVIDGGDVAAGGDVLLDRDLAGRLGRRRHPGRRRRSRSRADD
jgi:hypothetical protein